MNLNKSMKMSLCYINYLTSNNEQVLSYAPGSRERETLKKVLSELKSTTHDIPMYIGGKEVRTGKTGTLRPPHETAHVLGHYHEGDESHVKQAIDAALAAKAAWAA